MLEETLSEELEEELREVHHNMDKAKKKNDICLWAKLCSEARRLTKSIFDLNYFGI